MVGTVVGGMLMWLCCEGVVGLDGIKVAFGRGDLRRFAITECMELY